MPATLGSIDLENRPVYRTSDFLSGRATQTVLAELRGANNVIVSEPFAYKHHVKAGDSLQLALGESRQSFRIADVYYDYSSERGVILMDRNVMLKYLPDPAPSNLAVFVAPGANVATVRSEIESAAANYRVLIFANGDLRAQAVQIFDRTFAITYALEAVAVLVAVMGIAGALLALVIDRRRELGLLRYLGASSVQLRKLILDRSRTSRPAGKSFRRCSGIFPFADPDFRHQQTVVWMDDSSALARRGASRRDHGSVRRYAARRFLPCARSRFA